MQGRPFDLLTLLVGLSASAPAAGRRQGMQHAQVGGERHPYQPGPPLLVRVGPVQPGVQARMSLAADLSIVHALAGALAETPEAREQVEWSALHAQDVREPDGLPDAFSGLDPDTADRCLAQAREAYALGRITTAEEAAAATWRWRSGDFPRLVHLVGPSGSGKSASAAACRASPRTSRSTNCARPADRVPTRAATRTSCARGCGAWTPPSSPAPP